VGCNDRIWQTFTVPANYTKITITYWWYSDTGKTTKKCLDTFTSSLQDSSGKTIRNLQQSCNINATNGWVQESFDVSLDLAVYKGQQVTLSLQGMSAPNRSATSDFFVDDVVVVTVQ